MRKRSANSIAPRHFDVQFFEGVLRFFIHHSQIVSIHWLKKFVGSRDPETTLECQIKTQIDEYLHNERGVFDLPLMQQGTDFQNKVWDFLKTIPRGETRSYNDVALAIGHRKAARAVGSACNRNPFVIVVPCHRIISQNQKLGGYAVGTSYKEFVLNHEGATYVGAA